MKQPRQNPRLLCVLTAAALLFVLLPAGAQEEGLKHDRISLNVVGQDVATLLRMLAEAQRINIVAGQDVDASITLNLYEVPFDEALDAVLNAAGLTSYRSGDIIYVTTEERRGELSQATSQMEVLTVPLSHSAPEDYTELLEVFLSKGGKALAGANKSLVVVDTPERLPLLQKIISELDQPKRQVLIQVQIIGVERDDNLNLGTGFDTFPLKRYGIEALSGGFAQAYPPLPDATTGLFDVAQAPTDTGFFVGSLQSDFRAFIEALDTSTDSEILASPQILVMDGEKARLQVGDRLGFRITTTTDTASLESVEFLEVGTVLEVTPEVGADGLVSLEINPKVSSGFIDSDGLPTESTTEIQTNMTVQDGQSVIIGGLLNATRQRVRTQVPFLGDIPILGKLFGKTKWTDDASEVVVFLTPFIVSPQSTPEMAEKIEQATQRWQPLEEEGMLGPNVEPVKRSPTKRWRGLLQPENTLSVGVENPGDFGPYKEQSTQP